MSVENDPSIWAKVADWMWAVVLGAGGWGWTHTHGRIKEIQTMTESKASNDEHNRTKDNVAKIFDKMDEFKDDMNIRLTVLERSNHDRYDKLMEAIYERKDNG